MNTFPLVPVSPGDLITSNLINQVLSEIKSLDARISTLEGQEGGGGDSNAPVITSISPSGDLPEGADIHILGANFAVPANLNTVMLDSLKMTGFLANSTDTDLHMTMTVPGGIAGLPKDMTLSVATIHGSDSIGVRVVPPVATPTGQPIISNVTTGLPTILAGNSYTFSFKIDGSPLSMAETFQLTPQFENPVGATSAQWEAEATLIGVAEGQLLLTPESPVTVGVSVTVPASATSIQLSLKATSIHNSPGSDSTSPPVPVVVGEVGPNSDPRISLFLGAIGGAAHAQAVTIDGVLGLQVEFNQTVHVPIEARFQADGTYDYAVNDPGLPWLASVDPPTSEHRAAGNASQIFVMLQLNSAGPDPHQSTITLTVTRQESTGIGQISSFLDLPIKGFA